MNDNIEETAEVATAPQEGRRIVEQAGVIPVWCKRAAGTGAILFGVVQANSPAKEWVLAKGHLEEGESFEEAALREAAEELGAEGILLSGSPFFSAFTDQDHLIHLITWFPMLVTEEPVPSPEGRIVKWQTIYNLTHAEGSTPVPYPEMREMIHRVRRMV